MCTITFLDFSLQWCQEQRWLQFFEMTPELLSTYARAPAIKPVVLGFTSSQHEESSEKLKETLREVWRRSLGSNKSL